MKIRVTINLNIGRVVKYFVLVDLFLVAGWGLIDPIFSVFVVNKIPGATLITVGIAAGIYWILKSFLQLPVARYLDKRPGERDDFYTLVLGLLIVAASAFGFVLVRNIWELYLVQIIKSIGFCLYVASWPAIFSRHLDKEKVSFDWALDSTAVGLSAGISGFLAGVVASRWGYETVFIAGAVLSLISALVLLAAPNLILPPPNKTKPVMKDHSPINLGR